MTSSKESVQDQVDEIIFELITIKGKINEIVDWINEYTKESKNGSKEGR